MIRRFSGCLDAIVATDTTAGNGGVIHVRDDSPIRRDMAVRAFTHGRYVIRWF